MISISTNPGLITEHTPKTKVAHIITRLELGGAQQNTLYCCALHDRRRFEVILIAGAGGDLDPDALRIPECRTYLIPELKHPIHPGWDLIAFFKIVRLLRKEKVDLVHTHSSKAGILGRWAARAAGIRSIVHTVHGWGFYPGQFLPIRLLYIFLERATAPITGTIISVSGKDKKEGLSRGIGAEDQYRVIHSGIDPDLYRLSPRDGKRARERIGDPRRPTVLILSNFKPQKSPLDAVRTAARTAARIPNVLFLWAGDGPLRGRVEMEIAARGLEGNFKILGWRKDVAELLAASDVLLLTSSHEGLPRVVLQAMAAGRPVVATAVNGTPEAVKRGVTGFLHEPGDCDGMAESLVLVLGRPSQGLKMGRAGAASLKGTFRIDRMLMEIEKVYRELTHPKV